MPNSSYVGTGSLNFDKGINITPVIRALFTPFNIRWGYPGDRMCAVFAQDGDIEVTWGDILTSVKAECIASGAKIEEGDGRADLAAWLYALADQVGATDPDFVLHNLLENCLFESSQSAEFDVLFEIARGLDDGHGLSSIDLARSWTCRQPQVDELGGEMRYFGRDFSITGDTNTLRDQAKRADQALRAGLQDASQADAATAAVTKIISQNLEAYIVGINDPAMRSQVVAALPGICEQLAETNLWLLDGDAMESTPESHDDDEGSENTRSEFSVCVTEDQVRFWNPFETNFASADLAVEAAEDYLRENPEAVRAVVDKLTIGIDNDELDSTTVTDVLRDSPGVDEDVTDAPR